MSENSGIEVSVLIPSRGRKHLLLRAVEHLLKMAKYPSKIELLFRFDKDDAETIGIIPQLPQDVRTRVIIGDRLGGYYDINVFYNELASIAIGKGLFVFNDDAIIKERDWDVKIAHIPEISKPINWQGDDEIWIAGSKLFPVISRKVYEVLGHISPNTMTDSYVVLLAKAASCYCKVGININHRRIDTFETEVKADRHSYPFSKPSLFSSFTSSQIQKDARKLMMYVMSKHQYLHATMQYIFCNTEQTLPEVRSLYYDRHYLMQAYNIRHFKSKTLQYGDAVCGICYAFGVRSMKKVRRIFPFFRSGLSCKPVMHAKKQMELIQTNATREPKHVLDIGAGRGDVSVCLANHGIHVQSVEPSCDFLPLVEEVKKRFEMEIEDGMLQTFNTDIVSAIDDIDWDCLDTVFFIDSLEHITQEDFDIVYPYIKNALKKNKGMLIITNIVEFHPIWIGRDAPAFEHCRNVHDGFYDALVKDAAGLIERRNSHLVLQY